MQNQSNSLTSATPSNPLDQANTGQTNSPDLTAGPFSVNSPNVTPTPVPQPSPIVQTPESVATTALGNINARSAASSGGGGGGKGGGIPFGPIIGGISSLFGAGGGYFAKYAEGGYTRDKREAYAGGGNADADPDDFIEPPADTSRLKSGEQSQGTKPQGPLPPDFMNNLMRHPMGPALAMGYLIGALHQRDFNGTPSTLPQAAEIISKHISGNSQVGMADGGLTNVSDSANTDAKLAQVALSQALGLTNSSEDQLAGTQSQQPQVSPQIANALAASQAGQANSGQVSQALTQPSSSNMLNTQAQPNQASPQGFMQPLSYAGGGDSPPLAPGQAFQGDGQVKGPGGPTDDAIPAKLSNGEFVFSAPAVSFYGVDKLVKMNEQGKQGFMQALGQVQANQAKGPAAAMPQNPQGSVAPAATPPAGPSQQQPMMQAKGGPTMRNTSHGYCGI